MFQTFMQLYFRPDNVFKNISFVGLHRCAAKMFQANFVYDDDLGSREAGKQLNNLRYQSRSKSPTLKQLTRVCVCVSVPVP